MKGQSKRGKALSLALTASLVATLNVPAVAFAEEVESSATQDVEQQLDATAATAAEDAALDAVSAVETTTARACLQPRCFRERDGADANGSQDVTTVVAVVGDVEYTSLSEALDAATDGQTVKVLADTTMKKRDASTASPSRST